MTIVYLALGCSLFLLTALFAMLCHKLKED